MPLLPFILVIIQNADCHLPGNHFVITALLIFVLISCVHCCDLLLAFSTHVCVSAITHLLFVLHYHIVSSCNSV